MTGLGMSYGQFSVMDTIEPVIVMILGLSQADGCLVVLDQIFGIRFPGSAVYPDGSFSAVKNGASAPVRGIPIHDFNSICVDHF